MTETTQTKKDKTFHLLIISILTSQYAIFSIIFFQSIHFQAAFIKLSLFSLPLFILEYFLLNNYLTLKTSDAKSPRALKFFFLFAIHGFSFGSLNAINHLFDQSEVKEEKLVILDKDFETTKRSIIYKAMVLMPIKTSYAFLPETYDNVSISKEEYQTLIPGKAYVQIKYRMGLFNIPYLVEKKVLK